MEWGVFEVKRAIKYFILIKQGRNKSISTATILFSWDKTANPITLHFLRIIEYILTNKRNLSPEVIIVEGPKKSNVIQDLILEDNSGIRIKPNLVLLSLFNENVRYGYFSRNFL